MKLYELTHEYQEALDALSDNENFDSDTVKDTLDGLKCEVEEKCLNVAAYIKNCQAEVDAMKEYEQRMNKKRKVVENKVASLKEYLQHHMETTECTDIKGTELSLAVRLGPAALVIDDEALAFERFHKVRTVMDEAALKYCLVKGDNFEYAHLEHRPYLKIT